MTEWELLTCIKDRYAAILGGNLTGIYVHGSLAFDCFSWERSDIDFLVVVKTEPTLAQKTTLIRVLLDCDASAPQKGFEMSVVTEAVCRPFVYPTPYVLHYSNTYRDRYLADCEALCRTLHGTDPDLAAHITVTRAIGIVICGKPIDAVFGGVPAENYLDSIRCDIENAREDIHRDPVYIILNLCRVLAFVREGAILSKAGGGTWGLAHLPPEYRPPVQAAYDAYTAGTPFACTTAEADAFAAFLLRQIL
ncbi:MAG: DUF4111 domain-containing protein [Clostridia bacterium]|nr:DUF4111 domain-containing protein [Clostridia bacterium]